MKNDFYTYAYLREDGTPYYIGKGSGDRAFYKKKKEIKVPPVERILFLKRNLTEEEAFRHEIYMIAVFGRKDLGTGILRNRSNGGEGNSGHRHSAETRIKISIKGIGRQITEATRSKLRARPNVWLGRKHSKEARRKQSEAAKRRIERGDSHLPKLWESRRGEDPWNKGIPASNETRKKQSISQRKRFANGGMSEETKQKMREAQRKRREREKLERR
jgi:hypothetical protein